MGCCLLLSKEHCLGRGRLGVKGRGPSPPKAGGQGAGSSAKGRHGHRVVKAGKGGKERANATCAYKGPSGPCGSKGLNDQEVGGKLVLGTLHGGAEGTPRLAVGTNLTGLADDALARKPQASAVVAVGLPPRHDSQEKVAKDGQVGVKENHLGLAMLLPTRVAGRGAGNEVGVAEAQDKAPAAAVPPKAFPLKSELKAYAAREAT